MNKWTEATESHLYFSETDGRIIGMAHRLGISGPWYLAKICTYGDVDFTPIGNYIDLISAKNAVENYWNLHDNTINETKIGLLAHGNV